MSKSFAPFTAGLFALGTIACGDDSGASSAGGSNAGGSNAGGSSAGGSNAGGGGSDGTGGSRGGGDPCSGSIDCPASCAGLAATCGPSQNGNCCASTVIPGGTFNRWNDPAFPATVSSFRMDVYEVTVGRFRKFVDAGKGTQAAPPADGSGALPTVAGSGWYSEWNNGLASNTAQLKALLTCDPNLFLHTWTDNPGENESRPINCVPWTTAFAFCIWDGGRLATEVEWYYAAAGGSELRTYPWSSPPSSTDIGCANASFGCSAFGSIWEACGDGTNGCATTDFIVVGTKPGGNGRWGQADLSGNVKEWVRDSSGPTQVPCNDCVFLETSPAAIATKKVRGGSISSVPTPQGQEALNPLLVGSSQSPSSQGGTNVGIRCVRTP